MDVDNEFPKLVTKFLFLNCTKEYNEFNSNEINVLLNDLNSLDYNTKKIVDINAIHHLVDSITTIPVNEETLIVKACCLISTLLNKQKIQLPFVNYKKLIDWLCKCLELNFHSIACDVLSCLKNLFKHHPFYCIEFWEKFLLPDTLLLNILNNTTNHELPEDYDTNSSIEILISAVLFIQNLLSYQDSDENQMQSEINELHENILKILGGKVLDLLYSNKINLINNTTQRIVLITSLLNILYKIMNENNEWTNDNLGKILGISKAYIHYGLTDINQIKPQKISVSQQPIFETTNELSSQMNKNKGGKILKTRKLKTISKNKKIDYRNKNQNLKKDSNITAVSTANETNNSRINFEIDFDLNFLSSTSRVSDSDFSGSETGLGHQHDKKQNEMRKEAKIRLIAISLIGLIAKTIEKKMLYGYWHALFPTESLSHNNAVLLNCILRDPNARNRTAALQTTSVLLFGSKPYLIQAENSDKAPKTFTPFSISLGNMILTMYEILTQALSNESSLPVLTQVLKCLSVLIQATPFHRLRNGFVTKFVKYVRQLISHRDSTIQVAALMVMGFLINVQDTTLEISECIGTSKSNLISLRQNQNSLHDSGVEEVIETELDEEFLDSDCDDNETEIKQSSSVSVNNNKNESTMEMSWLLQKVLENLGIIFYNTKNVSKIPIPVRIESLQVLSSMSLHFLLIKDHLELISDALKTSLNDNQSEIRLYSAKCLDVIGDSINNYLLKNSNVQNSNDSLVVCQNFWTNILPTTIENIQDQNQSSVLKAHLCDFLSNIGVHIFERLPQNCNIQIISLLSGIGCNDESIVRAAAVRALAVYIAFPSLREDLCFIENTAELCIQLMNDTTLCTRTKASWAMGNISDAFIINSNDSQLDKISNNLLKQMFEVAINAVNDNDKVRSNAVRTLGNLLHLISEEHLEINEWRTICMKAIEKLTNCINSSSSGGNAKVKWNSCYAIGNFMKNHALFVACNQYENFNWKNLILPTLCNVIVNNTNFKVRINAAIALNAIDKRENYGKYMNLIWSSLLLAIEQSDNLNDFNEYKHKDNLQEQLCLTLSHIIEIATMDDFIYFKSELIQKLEIVKKIWLRVINRILPETSALLLSCTIKLENLLLKNNLTNEQRNSIQIISSCLKRDKQEEF